MNYLKFDTDYWLTLLVLLFVMELSKTSSENDQLTKRKKKSSENDQLTGHFQSFYFFVPSTLNLQKYSLKSINKKSGLSVD